MREEIWSEIDLYWFQQKPNGARILFDRLAPLYRRDPRARKGLSLCAGWLMDAVLFFNGDPDASIPCCQAPVYETWTYRRLGRLVKELKAEAKRRGIDSFHVVLAMTGTVTMEYSADTDCTGWSGRTEELRHRARYSIRGRWFPAHPEVDFAKYRCFDPNSIVRVPEDEQVVREAKPPFWHYFAQKLAAAAACCQLDGAVYRDQFFTPAYVRGNVNRYMPPEGREARTSAFCNLFRELKQLRPGFLNIGYHSGTSPTEELRAHGFDLERVAGEGNLDLMITQTWASAWQDYWPAQSMGFTFQLQNVLANLAMLAKTPCKHLFLIETFDAWEPWDSIHQYESKVRWEIWAYSHAQVKLPGGSRRSEGYYLSWLNRGKTLLPRETVHTLAATLDDVDASLEREPDNGGGCIVYDRENFLRALVHPLPYGRGEDFDDWCALLQKCDCSIWSIVRMEDLPAVSADWFFLPFAHDLDSVQLDCLTDKLAASALVFAGMAAELDEKLAKRFDIRRKAPLFAQEPLSALVFTSPDETGRRAFCVPQRAVSLDESPSFATVAAENGNPVLVRRRDQPLWIWETPEWGTPGDLHLFPESAGDFAYYRRVAALLEEDDPARRTLSFSTADKRMPINFLWARYADGSAMVLLGNLETGLTGNSQFATHGTLTLRADLEPHGLPGFAPGRLNLFPDAPLFSRSLTDESLSVSPVETAGSPADESAAIPPPVRRYDVALAGHRAGVLLLTKI